MFAETALDIGYLYQSINRSIHRDVMPEGITGQQYKILRYLACNARKRDVYLCEIEQKLDICRSTASELVTKMESKGYIRREALEDDARFKRLLLTEKGYDAVNRVVMGMDDLNQNLTREISDEEMQLFRKITAKLRRNMELQAAM